MPHLAHFLNLIIIACYLYIVVLHPARNWSFTRSDFRQTSLSSLPGDSPPASSALSDENHPRVKLQFLAGWSTSLTTKILRQICQVYFWAFPYSCILTPYSSPYSHSFQISGQYPTVAFLPFRTIGVLYSLGHSSSFPNWASLFK